MLNKNHLIVSILTIITNVCFPISQDKLELFKPENVQRFADYLFNEKDYERAANEYERFLYLSGEENDSTLFKIGICHQLLDQNEFALNVFKRIRNNNQYTIRKKFVSLQRQMIKFI